MHIDEFDYELPPALIAHTPPAVRGASRLMKLRRQASGVEAHSSFTEILEWLKPGDLLVMNDTQVIPARVKAKKPTGGAVELLFLRPEPDTAHGQCWLAMTRSSRPVREGQVLEAPGRWQFPVCARQGGGVVLLRVPEGKDLLSWLKEHGEMPLPPYIEAQGSAVDHEERYQTVYAQSPGAVAAPTAGLHFTTEMLQKIKDVGIRIATLTLHVGPGTFLPVRVEDILEHEMHTEFYEIPEATVEAWRLTRAEGGRVIAIGTTSLRALEACVATHGDLQAGHASTDIFIYPGYSFGAIDGLLTNFHLPRSTLLMLVSALHGLENTIDVYREAITHRYRFYSYGDAMLIL